MANETEAMVKVTATQLAAKYDNDRWHYLAPKTMMDGVPDGTRLVASQVQIDPDTDDVYPIQGAPNRVGICKPGLNQIAAASGITWTHSKRVDDRRHPHYVEWEVGGRMVMPDGSVREETANKTIDLRMDIGDGTPGADRKMMSEKQIPGQLANICSMAETKAKNRLIRSMTGLKTSYKKDDLRKPFVCVKLSIDPRSELGGRAALGAMTGATNALFGPPQQAKVVDAEIEQPEPAAAGGSPPDDDVDPETGEVNEGAPKGTPEIIGQVKKLWLYAKSKEMPPATFKEICAQATGKESKDEFTQGDVDAVVARVEAWVANSDDEEEVPV